MYKNKAFTLTEIFVVILLIVITACLVISDLIEDNKKLDTISKWKNTYKNVEYVFSALQMQATETDNISFKKALNNQEKETVLYEMLTPYFRMENEVLNQNYKTYYLNGKAIKENDDYYITNLHTTNSGKIVGLKWLNTPEKIQDKLPVALMSIDLNGIKKPNKWGYDIFGVNIYTNRIEPLGKSDDEYLLKSDCSKKGKGLTCSYYYYIYGGQLD